MSSQLTFADLMAKVEMLCSAAHLLLDHGDTGSAANRAYYAMHNAACVALIVSGVQEPDTHSGLIRMFGLHLVKNGPLPSEMAEILGREQRARIIADYKSTSIKTTVAKELVEQAENFVASIKALQFDKQPDPPKQEPTSGSSFDLS